MNKTLHNQSGLTLVELMVAMVISLLLLGGTITIFMSNKQSYLMNEASSRVQENGRFSLDFLKDDIRMTGFMGCISPANGNFTNNVDPTQYTTNAEILNAFNGYTGLNSLKGYSYTNGALPAELINLGLTAADVTTTPAITQDIIIVKKADSCEGGNVVTPKTNANFKISSNDKCLIGQNQVVIASDCLHAGLFAVTNNPTTNAATNATLTTGGNINSNIKLSGNFGTDAEILIFQTSIYYIGPGASGEPSLFRRTLVSRPAGRVFENQELIEGIESMTAEYGVDTDGDSSANYYVNAAGVNTDWDSVISVRITLRARSSQQNIVQSNTFADKRLRHTFSETIRIRNR